MVQGVANVGACGALPVKTFEGRLLLLEAAINGFNLIKMLINARRGC